MILTRASAAEAAQDRARGGWNDKPIPRCDDGRSLSRVCYPACQAARSAVTVPTPVYRRNARARALSFVLLLTTTLS